MKFHLALPILGSASTRVSERFYCDQLGFHAVHAYRPAPERDDPCWLVVQRDGAMIVLSSFEGDRRNAAKVVQVYVDDLRAVHAEFAARGVEFASEILEQSWNNLELFVNDPDGNRIVIAQDLSG